MVEGFEIDSKEVQANLKVLSSRYSDAVAKGAVQGALLVQGAAIKSIQSQSMGSQDVRYTTAGQPYNHVTSEEGDAPNTDTGALVNSIFVEVKKTGVFVGSRLNYSRYLENGTKTMGARPWLNPALESNRVAIRKLIGRKVNKITQAYNR